MSRQAVTQTLVESFCALADEVQNLTDRKTILEHKLRFAAEQVRIPDLMPFDRRITLHALSLFFFATMMRSY